MTETAEKLDFYGDFDKDIRGNIASEYPASCKPICSIDIELL